MSLKRRGASVILGVLVATAMASAPANARVLHVTGQQTTITPSAQALQFLGSNGISISAVGAASISDGKLTLPIAGGFITRRLNGAIFHRGGVRYAKGTRSLTLRVFVLSRVHHHLFLSARVHAHRLVLARVTNVSRTIATGSAMLSGELRLTVAGARKINHLFGAGTAPAGADLGSLTSTITFS